MISTRRINALLLALVHRNAGESEANGKHLKWDEADVLHFLPVGTKDCEKYKISPRKAQDIYKLTQDITWGAYVALTVNSNNEVVNVEVLNDVFAEVAM